jgi:hypothetical protein
MNAGLLFENLTNPALLFFFLGILAVQLRSDLEIPPTSARFISSYLLLAIGFKGGQELSHSSFSMEILWSMFFGLALACLIPLYTFFILKTRLNPQNAGAIAASYGSVSAVTFVTAASYLELHEHGFSGHMVATMALMEAPAIIIGVFLISLYDKTNSPDGGMKGIVRHSFTNGSVLLILGSLIIGLLASDEQANGIKPFTTDLFKGFLAVFLLDMGVTCGRKLGDFFKNGWFTVLFAVVIPLVNGSLAALASAAVSHSLGDRFMLAILAASASYIAVPAAMRIAAPKANPGLFLPMALGVTFPLNITLGMPVFYMLIQAS